MYYRNLFFLFALLASAPLFSATLDCLVHFASTPQGAINFSLIDSTYDQLIDKLGGQLGSGAKAKMKADPLKVPTGVEGDFLALERALKNFEEMLRQKGWNTPEVRARLASRLTRRDTVNAEVIQRVNESLLETRSHLTIPFTTHHGRYTISPDSRWLVYSDVSPQASAMSRGDLVVLDVKTSELKRYPIRGPYRPAHFSADGKNLLLPLPKAGVAVVPFELGVPQLDRRSEMGAIPVSSPIDTADPNVLYGEGALGTLVRIDLAAKKVIPLDLTSVIDDGDTIDTDGLRVIPGTSALVLNVLQTPRRTHSRYIVVDVAADGRASVRKGYEPQVRMNNRDYMTPLTFQTNGEPDLFGRAEKIFRQTGPGQSSLYLDTAAISPGPGWQVKWEWVMPRPGHPDQLIVGFVDPNHSKFARKVWDAKSGQVLFTYDLNFSSFSPDGQLLVVPEGILIPGATLKIHNTKMLQP